jgi:hypothetical protein
VQSIKVRRIDFYPVDWLEGTVSLTHVERSVYITVCAAIYAQGGPVETAHVLKLCPGRWSKQGLEGLIAKGKVTLEGTHVVQSRCVYELGRASDRVQSARVNGSAGGRPINDLGKPNGLRSTRVTRVQTTTNKKNPSSSVESVAARTSLPNGRAGRAHDDETVAWKKVGNALPLATTPPPPLFPAKAQRAGQHWNFLREHGASGEADRYYAAMMESGISCPPDEIFDAVEVRMTSA